MTQGKSKKYSGPLPNRKTHCECIPKPMLTKVSDKPRGVGLGPSTENLSCQKCGLPVTRATIIKALRRRFQ